MDWFGDPTTGTYIDHEWREMQEKRVMEISTPTMRVNPIKYSLYDEPSQAIGNKYFFTSKIEIIWGGKKEVCLRTQYDTDNDIDRCIIMSRMKNTAEKLYSLEEFIPAQFAVTKDTYKIDLKSGQNVQEIKASDSPTINVSAKINYNGVYYYQTTHDKNHSIEYFIPADDLYGIAYNNFLYPRNMETSVDVSFVDLLNNNICKNVKAGYIQKYTTKTIVKGVVYFRTETATSENSNCVIPASKLNETTEDKKEAISFNPFLFPRNLRVTKDMYAFNLQTGESCENEYLANGTIKSCRQRYCRVLLLERLSLLSDDQPANSHRR